jgi:hypothetical protein
MYVQVNNSRFLVSNTFRTAKPTTIARHEICVLVVSTIVVRNTTANKYLACQIRDAHKHRHQRIREQSLSSSII